VISAVRRDRVLAAVLALTALGAALRFATLDVQSLSGDEGVTGALLRMPLGDMLSTIPHTESTPPLYYVLAWLWTQVLGHGAVGMRSLSALAGTAAVPAVYAAGRALASERVGIVAAGLAAVSPLLVWYSQEARSYSLLVLLAALSLWLLARALEDPRGRNLAAWAAVCALALATHYYAGFLVMGEAAWLVSQTRPRRSALLACAGVAAAALALLPLALDQRSTGNFTRFIEQIGLTQRVKEVPKKFLIGEQGTPGDYGQPAEALKFVAAALTLLAAGLLLARARGRERAGGITALAVGAVAAGFPLALAVFGFDYFAAYLLIGAWVPLAVAAAAGLAAGGRLGAAGAVALGAAMLAVTISVPAGHALRRPDYRAAARALGHASTPRAVVANPDNSLAPLDQYLGDLDPMPLAGARVAEIDVLGMRSRDETWRTRTTGSGPASIPHGFRVFDRVVTGRFTLLRLRAARPRLVTGGEIADARLGEGPPAAALQR
jgi:4-amino-4-deoxy-L-arabinose transferase-like glycosyltransferase